MRRCVKFIQRIVPLRTMWLTVEMSFGAKMAPVCRGIMFATKLSIVLTQATKVASAQLLVIRTNATTTIKQHQVDVSVHVVKDFALLVMLSLALT